VLNEPIVGHSDSFSVFGVAQSANQSNLKIPRSLAKFFAPDDGL
jgi:hypothetical protein